MHFTRTCMSMVACRLVAGDVAGNIKQLFTRIEGILKKSGPFEVCNVLQLLPIAAHAHVVSRSDASLRRIIL